MIASIDDLRALLGLPLFSIGDSRLTTGSLLALLLELLMLFVFAGWLQRWMLNRLLRHAHLEPGTRQTVASLTRYGVLGLGLVMVLEAGGIRLSSFTVIAGALGVGVGFGLQNIFSNFVSGLIVMFERPVRLGDHISIAGVDGDVINIGMRATSLLTAQGGVVIVPNQTLITGNVVNWGVGGASAATLQWRMRGPVDDDETLVLQVLQAHPDVGRSPTPQVYVVSVDHAGHLLEAHFCVLGNAQRRLAAISDLNRQVLATLERCQQQLAPNP